MSQVLCQWEYARERDLMYIPRGKRAAIHGVFSIQEDLGEVVAHDVGDVAPTSPGEVFCLGRQDYRKHPRDLYFLV